MKTVKMVLEADKGEHVEECKLRAVEMALRHEVDIEFTHNDRTWIVRYVATAYETIINLKEVV